MRFRHLAVGLASAALIYPAGSASAGIGNFPASTGRTIQAISQAGYAVTGAHFLYASTWVRLPDAARFSRELGSLSVSVQLWNRSLIVDLTATACTDSSCRPGGRPVTRTYRLRFAVYRRRTGALICSTSGKGRFRCPQVDSVWTQARIAPGKVAHVTLGCPASYMFIDATVNTFNYTYFNPAPELFGQARIGLQFGTGPWSRASFRAPRKPIGVARFDARPNAAEIATVNGFGGGFVGFFAHHAMRMTGGRPPGHVEARPGRLWDSGYGFTVYLEPRF